MNEYLMIASLVVSLFLVVSQIGVIRKLREMEMLIELLMLEAVLNSEIQRRKDEEEGQQYGD